MVTGFHILPSAEALTRGFYLQSVLSEPAALPADVPQGQGTALLALCHLTLALVPLRGILPHAGGA